MSISSLRRARDAGGRRGVRALGAVSLSIVLGSCSTSTPSTIPSPAATTGAAATSTVGASAASPVGASAGSPAGALLFPDPSTVFNPTKPPIDLTVTPESNNTVTATIPTAGGALSATGADGTVYTLTIPGDALVGDTEIAMTPVATVIGLPTGGEMTFAVQLAPEGLHLDDFATLTIAPTKDLPVDEQIPFGYEGAGKAMFLAIPVVKDPRIQLLISHFSGYGVTKGLLASLKPAMERLGRDADARLESALATFFAQQRALALNGHPVPANYRQLVESLLDDYERDVVDPRVAAARQSCANAQLAFNSVLNLKRQRALMEVPDPRPLPLDVLAIKARVCTQEEYEICRDDHIVHRMLDVINEMDRERQQFGVHDPAEWASEKDLARKCLTFEVRFTSETTELRGPVFVVSEVKSTINISLDTDSLEITGGSALINVAFEARLTVPGDCQVKATRGGSDMKVTNLTFKFEKKSDPKDPDSATDPGTLTDIFLYLLPRDTTEDTSVSCPGSPRVEVPGPWWSAIYERAHADDRPSPTGPYTTHEWKASQATKLGTKEWDFKDLAAHVTEKGTLALYHRPS